MAHDKALRSRYTMPIMKTIASDSAAAISLDHQPLASASAGLCFDFSSDEQHATSIACEFLSGVAPYESWHIHNAGAYRFFSITSSCTEDKPIQASVEQAYQDLLQQVRPSSHPYILRIWNYFSHINQGQGDQERYRQFCVGRAKAVDGQFNNPPPAATAIGTEGDEGEPLHIIALCANYAARTLENPRQTPAWRYPREYGPVPPGFSRGIILDEESQSPRLLASGTASIVGHISKHIGEVSGQLTESLANLEALLVEGSKASGRDFELTSCEALRVYLRKRQDLAIAESIISASGIDRDKVLYLRGDVCRRELDVELEGVFIAKG
jgi:chorismate lyase / 3-hydroxybenzoate synthase